MKAIVLEKTLVHDGNRFLIDVEFPEIKQTVRLALDETATEADLQAAVQKEAIRIQAEIDSVAAKTARNQAALARFANTVGRELIVDKDKVTVGEKAAAEEVLTT